MSGSITFSHKVEYDAGKLPGAQETIQAAIELVNEIKPKWSKGKTFHERGEVVKTFNTRKGGDFWMARLSNHPTDTKDSVSFEEFKKYILFDHAEYEVKYIPLLESCRSHKDEPDVIPKKDDQGWEAHTVHYKFPRMFSDREMAIWVLGVQPDPAVDQFFVISLPSSHKISSHATRAVYCAIEMITYNKKENTIEWLMAQSSDAGGSIPRWVQDKSVTASVAADVPSFITWAREETKKKKAAGVVSEKEVEEKALEEAVFRAEAAKAENFVTTSSNLQAAGM